MGEPSETLESYFHQKKILSFTVQGSIAHVAWQSQFAASSYFMVGVISWQLYSKENQSPSGGDPALFRMKTFWSSSGCKFFTSSAVNWGFFWISILKKVSAAYAVFLLLPPPNLCFGAALLISPLAKDKSFIMVDLALLLCLHIIFIGTFFTPGKNMSLLAIITIFSRHVKMVFSKTNTSLMIYTELSLMQQNTPSLMMSPEDLNSSNFNMIMM